jgi:Ser/Thr protein kinase RdoA (MazF antagonist)
MTASSCDSPVHAFARFTDVIAMGELWRKQLPSLLGKPFEFTDCNVQYARCRTYLNPSSWHKSFLCVCYEFDGAQKRETSHNPMVYGRAYSQGRSRQEFAAWAQSAGARLVPELDMIAWVFPDDPRLPQLRELLDVARVARHLPYASLPFAAHAIAGIKIDVVRYRPEQRCILRYDIDHGANRDRCVLYAKVFADNNGERVFSRIQHCYARSNALGVRVARPLGYTEAVRAVWQEELSGTPLTVALGAGDYHASMKAIGHCLAKLHTADLPMQKAVTREARLADASKKSRKLAQMIPTLADELAAIIARGQSDLGSLPPARKAVIHGDLHCGQFLTMADSMLALFDFDEWSHGDPAQDLGDLIVDPYVNRLALDSAEINCLAAPGIARALLASYRGAASWTVTDAEIAWQARVQLINKAYRVAIQQEPRWQDKVIALVVLATRGIDLGANWETEESRDVPEHAALGVGSPHHLGDNLELETSP